MKKLFLLAAMLLCFQGVILAQSESIFNGNKMITFEDEKIGKATGKIALQIHSGGGIKVQGRNLNILEIK